MSFRPSPSRRRGLSHSIPENRQLPLSIEGAKGAVRTLASRLLPFTSMACTECVSSALEGGELSFADRVPAEGTMRGLPSRHLPFTNMASRGSVASSSEGK